MFQLNYFCTYIEQSERNVDVNQYRDFYFRRISYASIGEISETF